MLSRSKRTLSATPLGGFTFAGWSGGGCAGTGSCVLIVGGPVSVTATFTPPATTLTSALGIKSGAQSTRAWPVNFTNSGPDNASGIQITAFTVTQTAGAACAPVVTTAIPVSVGSIAGAGTASAPVTINFTGCVALARFRLNLSYTANGGAISNTLTLNNQLQ